MNKRLQRNFGYTLIELLMSIAIYTIIAALLLQGLGKARGVGKRVICANNLKQIGIAVELYTQEYSEYTPALRDGDSNVWIHVVLNRYLNNSDVFWCPSSGADRKWDGQNAPLLNEGISYGFNCFGTGSFLAAPHFSGFCNLDITNEACIRSRKEVRAPEQLIVAADSFYDMDYEYSVQYPDIGLEWGPGDIHNGGCNVLFADGHVSWHSIDYLRYTTHIWNFDNTANDY